MSTDRFQGSTFDLALVAGPNLPHWPSVGPRTLSRIATDHGLSVAWLGGAELRPLGVIPGENAGGTVFVEDAQKRIHRIEARAIVRFARPSEIAPVFPGSIGPGCLPGTTGENLLRSQSLRVHSSFGVLGSGNRALEFAIRLLEADPTRRIHLVEPRADWGGKRYAGWEVFRRRFESLGGKWVEGVPVALVPTPSATHEMFEWKIRDSRGTRVLEVERVFSFGPFDLDEGYREYPAGSLLYELRQSSAATKEGDVDGYARERALAELLGVKLAKLLGIKGAGQPPRPLDSTFNRAKRQWKALGTHFDESHTFRYAGKFLSTPELRTLREFPGVPRAEPLALAKASIECIEKIECTLCEDACPERAIQIRRRGDPPTFLIEADCTACGVCVKVCPASVPVLLRERTRGSTIEIGFARRNEETYTIGETVELSNRRGESVGIGRVTEIRVEPALLLVEAPIHLQWEARAVRKQARRPSDDPHFTLPDSESFLEGRVSVTLNEEKRLVRDGRLLTETLAETGYLRGEDQLFCRDGSCGRCRLEVDGIKQLACKTRVRKGMQIRLRPKSLREPIVSEYLCPCLRITSEEFRERVRTSRVSDPATALGLTECGTGVCHGQACVPNALRILREEGLSFERFVDWRFPWVDWKFGGALD